MGDLVTYDYKDGIATITMDDGKANVLSPAMQGEINAALDQGTTDKAVVVLTGREGTFSGGFDLRVLTAGGPDAMSMLFGGFELAERLLGFPTPVVIAVSGHAIAMGAFLVLSADYRIGAAGAFKLQANEVAIGLPLPRSAVEVCRQRLSPTYFNRVTVLSEPISPDDAIAAGFLDKVVAPAELAEAAQATAARLAKLNMAAHIATKMTVRATALKAIRAAIDADKAQLGVKV
ncbi:MAG: crotonase/enoyl-CoA hydratase family protein [Chloroflexota bacterium]